MSLVSAGDIAFLRGAIKLAREAERKGNLPIGALITLDGQVVGEGMNAMWSPSLSLARHAEMEAMRSVAPALWPRAHEMTLYTTLEPCLMCAGAILLHQIGRVVYGAADAYGGSGVSLGCLAPYFQEQFSRAEWIGPALPEECDPLQAHTLEILPARGQFDNAKTQT
jgi:tRNA(adenine34) deaminase